MTITTTIKAGDLPRTINLPEGQALTLSGSAGTAGVAYQLDPVLGGTNSIKSWAIGPSTLPAIGAFSGTQQFLITCAAGSIDVTVGDAVLRSPSILAQVAVQTIILSSATAISATGAITGLTAVIPAPPGVVRVYCFAQAGLAAGMYYAIFSSTTACQLYTEAAGTITPTGITPGAYTGGTAEVTLASVTVPGTAMGASGALRVSPLASFTSPSTAPGKTIRMAFGGFNFMQSINTTVIFLSAMRTLRNRSVAAQITESLGSIMPATSNSALVALSINTGVDQVLTITGQLTNAADYIILEGYIVELIPG